MILSAVDLGIEIDFETDQPGAILQRKEKGYWHDYLVDGNSVVNPFDVESLPPGFYRLVDSV
ncbi:MAG: hypothetical protein GQ563_02180 [Desulfuromusa sp.]|nr:hypothetical protein [Desulfuromusa sp.]